MNSMVFRHIPSGNLTWLWKDPPFSMSKSAISMAIFHGYVSHYQRVNPIQRIIKDPSKNHHKIPSDPSFSYGFPMAFLWFHVPIRLELGFQPPKIPRGAEILVMHPVGPGHKKTRSR